MEGSRGGLDDFEDRFGVAGALALPAGRAKTARMGRADDNQRMMAEMRKTKNRNPTTDTKAKMTPCA